MSLFWSACCWNCSLQNPPGHGLAAWKECWKGEKDGEKDEELCQLKLLCAVDENAIVSNPG